MISRLTNNSYDRVIREIEASRGLSINKEGHARVPRRYITPDGFKLGTWAAKKRARKEDLSAEQIQAFEHLNDWSWNLLDSFFDDGYSHLESFIEKNKHALVPHDYITPDGFKLGGWVFGLRQRRETLSKGKVGKLEKIETWAWSALDAQFDISIQLLKTFVEKEGHSAVPQKFLTPCGFRLGGWVSRIRGRKESLSEEVLQLLDEVGFVWDNPQAEKSFVQGFDSLQDYKKQNGHVQVPMRYISDNGFKLGSWVNRIRRKKETISKSQLELLNKIDFVWDARDYQWKEGLKNLQDFVSQNGHAHMLERHLTDCGFKLGKWVGRVRRKKEQLSKDKIARLDGLGFVWDASKTPTASKND